MKVLTSIRDDVGYYFQCVFDDDTDILKDFEEAQRNCATLEVCCDYEPKEETAMIYGSSPHEQVNKAEVECIHSYLLEHGWTLEE